MKRFVLVICLAACLAGQAQIARFDSLPAGTWVRRAAKDTGHATMVIETAGTGRKLTSRLKSPAGAPAR